MPKHIVTPLVVNEKSQIEIIEAAGFVPQDGWIVFFDDNKLPKVVINRETIARVEVSTVA